MRNPNRRLNIPRKCILVSAYREWKLLLLFTICVAVSLSHHDLFLQVLFAKTSQSEYKTFVSLCLRLGHTLRWQALPQPSIVQTKTDTDAYMYVCICRYMCMFIWIQGV